MKVVREKKILQMSKDICRYQEKSPKNLNEISKQL